MILFIIALLFLHICYSWNRMRLFTPKIRSLGGFSSEVEIASCKGEGVTHSFLNFSTGFTSPSLNWAWHSSAAAYFYNVLHLLQTHQLSSCIWPSSSIWKFHHICLHFEIEALRHQKKRSKTNQDETKEIDISTQCFLTK